LIEVNGKQYQVAWDHIKRIVCEEQKTVKLEVGKRYKTRDGQETNRLGKHASFGYPFKGKVGDYTLSWPSNGLRVGMYSPHPLDLVEEIVEDKEEAVGTISQELLTDLTKHQYLFQKSKYTKTEEADGTIILKPKKRKVWIEVYECEGEIDSVTHKTKENLDKSLKYGRESGEILLEVIEREYPVNKE